ncbi:MAG: 2-oxoglutarate oxidoreductase, partial [Gemmatimonadota bacterium]
MSDYEGARARWCSGCGDHSVLASMQRLLADENLPPEKTVFVSGIGCSSRFP